MHLFIKDSIFHHCWPKFRPRFWDIFSILGNTLINHFFSIVISCEKAKKDRVGFGGSDAPFHQIFKFHIFWPKFRPRFWDIFSILGNTLMNHIFSIVISCEKAKTVLWGFADPMHLFTKHTIFHQFWPKLRPRFWDIFSISGNALMNHIFSIVISREKAKNDRVMFGGSDAPFHQRFNFSSFLAQV